MRRIDIRRIDMIVMIGSHRLIAIIKTIILLQVVNTAIIETIIIVNIHDVEHIAKGIHLNHIHDVEHIAEDQLFIVRWTDHL